MLRYVFLCMLVAAMTGCARPATPPPEPARILPLESYRQLQRVEDIAASVGFLEAGTQIPVRLQVDSPWLGLEEQQIQLLLKRRIYFRVVLPGDYTQEQLDSLRQKLEGDHQEAELGGLLRGVMLLLGRDPGHLAPLTDGTALKEAFDIRDGLMSAGLGLNTTEGLSLTLSLKTLGD